MRKFVFLLALLTTCAAFAEVVTDDKGKSGYQNEAGELVIPYSYDFIGEFNEYDVALVKSGKKWGMISKTGEIKLPVKYDEIGLFNQGLAHVASGKKYGMVNEKGELVCKPQFQMIYRPNSDGIRIAVAKKNKKASTEFDAASTYSVLTKEGKMMFPANYGTAVGSYTKASLNAEFVSQFKNGQDTLNTELGYIRLGTAKNPTIYDLEGNVIYDDTQRDAILQEAFGAKAKVGNKNTYGPFSDFTPLEDVIRIFYNQKGKNNQLDVLVGYYDLKEQKLIKYYLTTYSKGATIFNWNPDEEIGLMPFSEGFAVVHLKQGGNPRSEMIDKAGNVVGTFPHFGCMSYHDGYAVVRNSNQKWGVIDLQQNQVIPYHYDEVAVRVNGKEDALILNAKQGNKWGVVNMKDEAVVPFEYDGLVSFEGSEAIFVVKDSKWGAFNATKSILPCEFDSLKWFKNEAFVCYHGKDVSVYSIPLAKMSDNFLGFSRVLDADQEYHNGSFWELYKIAENGTDTVFGYVDGKADIVVPFVFSNEISSERAYKFYRNLPTQQFGELELYRMMLHFSVRERTYQLDAIVPNNDWDY